MNVQEHSTITTKSCTYANSMDFNFDKLTEKLLNSTNIISAQALYIIELKNDLECATDLNRKNIKIISKYEQEINEYRSLTEKLAQICVNQGTISLDSKETGLDRLRAIVKELSEKDTTPESK